MAWLWIAAAYALLVALVWSWEARRVGRGGIDVITVFVVLCLLQTGVAAVAVYGLLPFADPAAPTTNPVFDRIFQATSLTNALLVLCLTAWFVVWFYAGCALATLALPGRPTRPKRWYISVRGRWLAGALAVGLVLTLVSFVGLGESLASRYVNLILFRNLSDAVPRTTLRATAFALTQTWAWLAVLAMCFLAERAGRRWLKAGMLAVLVVFALLGVSRRALFLPMLLAYLTLVLHNRRWYAGWVLVVVVPGVVWVAFGKALFSALALGVPLEGVSGTYQSLTSALLRAAAEMGITVVESLGTLAFMPNDLRLGLDHVLSLARRLPEGMFGFSIDWPQRIVRTSTEAFAGHDAPDIPPGLLGQMWLDFRLLGPVVWGVMLGLQVGAVQWAFRQTEAGLGQAATAVLVIFVIALPINTGSLDFTFSVEIIALAAILLACVRLVRTPVGDDRGVSPNAASGPTRAATE